MYVDDFASPIQQYETKITVPIKELNHVLGNGLTIGSTILLGGDPGIGKSTLLMQLVDVLGQKQVPCLYVSGEESITQIKSRASRLNFSQQQNSHLIATNTLEDIISTAISLKDIKVVIIDSIQTIVSKAIDSIAGTTLQVKTCAQSLSEYAKSHNVCVFLVGHITKEGQIAGPKILEHMVDTVLYFEGDENNHYRILRSIKNRFGSVNEVGIFEMTKERLVEVLDPSSIFLSKIDQRTTGISTFVGINGSRAMLIEIQVLIAPSVLPAPRRTVIGWDPNRLSMILAILSVKCGINLNMHDVYLTVAGGLKIKEPTADLAVAAALISARLAILLPLKSVFLGEISLSGTVKQTTHLQKRINQSKKLGFTTVFAHDKISDKDVNCIHLPDVESLKTKIQNYK